MAEILDDYREVLRTPAGKRVILDILISAGVLTDPMTGNSQTFHNCGALSLGLSVLDNVRAADMAAFGDLMIQLTEGNTDG